MNTVQKVTRFSKGEVSIRLKERTDLDILWSSLSYMKNYLSINYGGFRTRPGTLFIKRFLKHDVKMIPFLFNSTERYLVSVSCAAHILTFEFADINGTTVYTTTKDIGVDINVKEIKYTQNESMLVLTHNDFSPIKIQLNEGDREIETMPIFSVGETSKSGFTLSCNPTPAPTGITPSDYLYLLSDGNDNTYYGGFPYGSTLTNVPTDTVNISFDGSYLINRMTMYVANCSKRIIKGIQLDDSEITLIDEEADNDTTELSPAINITTPETIKALKFELTGVVTRDEETQDITGGTSPSIAYVHCYHGTVVPFVVETMTLDGIPMYAYSGETVTPVTNNSFAISGISGLIKLTFTTDVTTDLIGQYIDAPDYCGKVIVTSRVDNKTWWARTIVPFLTTDGRVNKYNILSGYEPVLSAVRGYPSCCTFYQQRLVFGGLKSNANMLMFSRVGEYENFNNLGNYTNDGFSVEISNNTHPEVVNLVPNRGLQVLCRDSEWIVGDGILTPNIAFTRNSSNGSSSATPVECAGITLFVERTGKSVLGFIYNYDQAAYSTPALSVYTQDLIKQPERLSFFYDTTGEKGNYLFILNYDGTMGVGSLLLDSGVQSFSRIELNAPNRFADVCILDNEIFIITEDNTYSYLLKMDFDLITDRTVFVTGNTTIGDLDDYFNDGDVVSVNDGAGLMQKNYGTYTIENGSITGLPDEVIGHQLAIGNVIECVGRGNNISINSLTESIHKRIAHALVATNNTQTGAIKMNDKKGRFLTNHFEFNAVTAPDFDCHFEIKSDILYVEVLSVDLDIQYGAR